MKSGRVRGGKEPPHPAACITAEGQVPWGPTVILKGVLPKYMESSGMERPRWVVVGQGWTRDPRASLHKMTHLTGQGTPGRRGRPSSPTVVHCSLSRETWQPHSSQTGGFFSSSVGHAFPRHIFPPSKGFVQAPGSDHKKCPFLWRAHLRHEVPESQTAC